MNFSALFFFLLVAMVSALPLEMLRYKRQAYQPNSWGYNTQRRQALWRFGGVGGPSGEGSTWEGASIYGIHDNDISVLGR